MSDALFSYSSVNQVNISPSLSETSTEQFREKTLKKIAENASDNWKSLPLHWQIDKEFVLTALLKSPFLPGKSEFERKFPQELRFDKEVVLGFCQRHDFEDLYQYRHLFVPGCLTGDKDVMLAYCKKIPRSLQECAEELTDSPEVVNAAISLGGLELQYASLRLQEDKTTVMKACQSHGRALEFCPPGRTRSELVHDREFMLNTVLAKEGGGPMWRLLPSDIKHDAELLLMALKNGLMLRDVPKPFMNLDFLTYAVQSNAGLYVELPKTWQTKEDLATQAALSATSTSQIIARVLKQCPQLKQDRNIVLQIARTGSLESLQDLLGDDNFQYLDDLEVMKMVIERDTKYFAHASRRLQQASEIILVSITPDSAWNTLKVVPWSIQRNHPAIPIKAIAVSMWRNLRYLPSHIPEDLWRSDRNLGIAWIRRGGRLLDSLETLLTNDPGMALEVAKHNWSEFYKVGDQLLRDRAFMLQALEQDGRVIRFANSILTQDVDILVTAVAHHPIPTIQSATESNIQQQQQRRGHSQNLSSLQSTFSEICNLPDLSEQIQSKLNLHSTFLFDFLRGIAISPEPNIAPNLRSQLPMLDRGVETSQAFKELISNYLGVPIGKELRLLRRAANNLEQHPISSTASNSQGCYIDRRRGNLDLTMMGFDDLTPMQQQQAWQPGARSMIMHQQRVRRMERGMERSNRLARNEREQEREEWTAAQAQGLPDSMVHIDMGVNDVEDDQDRDPIRIGDDEDEEAEEVRILAAAMGRLRQQQEDEMNNPLRHSRGNMIVADVPDNRLL
jgi:hypothetical protein